MKGVHPERIAAAWAISDALYGWWGIPAWRYRLAAPDSNQSDFFLANLDFLNFPPEIKFVLFGRNPAYFWSISTGVTCVSPVFRRCCRWRRGILEFCPILGAIGGRIFSVPIELLAPIYRVFGPFPPVGPVFRR